jgi:hypothetical protein
MRGVRHFRRHGITTRRSIFKDSRACRRTGISETGFDRSGTARTAAPTVLENMRTAVREYGLRFAGNPVGTNPEITQALNGGNPKQIKFIRPGAGLQINGKGELLDPWGHALLFSSTVSDGNGNPLSRTGQNYVD